MSEEIVRGAKNTDRELWRGPDQGFGGYYSDSIFVTDDGAVGINCGGHVIVLPLREWHRRARSIPPAPEGEGRRDAEFWLQHIHVTLGSPTANVLKQPARATLTPQGEKR